MDDVNLNNWVKIEKEKAVAYGREENAGILVLAGSTAMRDGSPNEKRNRKERKRLVKEGVLVPDEDPDLYRFSRDYFFSSRSRSAGIIIDGNSNGAHWRSTSELNLVPGPIGTNVSMEPSYGTPMANSASSSTSPTNLILYGPPGTGKTYITALEAVRLCLGAEKASTLGSDRSALMRAYADLVQEGRIEFVTFHQSFTYEDFVEGLRPTTEVAEPDEFDDANATPPSGGFSLRPHDGIFKRISDRARRDGIDTQQQTRLDRSREVFKVSLGRRGKEEAAIVDGLDNGLIHLGYGGPIDWSDPQHNDYYAIRDTWRKHVGEEVSGKDPNIEITAALRAFMQVGDYIVLSDGLNRFRAFGVVEGDYYYDHAADHHPHRRKVQWLWRDDNGADRNAIYGKVFRQQSIYRLNTSLLDWDALETLIFGPQAIEPAEGARSHVLIIDEINRANISKVFGELITLLEPDKRLGMENEIRLRLPYSGTLFGVPANLHIIGTMNTADRSIALLDTALRRRFQFRELMPDPTLLPTDLDGIDLRMLLTVLNERIEYLFDREHQIGHAYFIGCRSQNDVEAVMRDRVIPLLAEYFFDDWSKIAAVLGEQQPETAQSYRGRFLGARRLTPPGLGGLDGDEQIRLRWEVLPAFDLSEFAVR